MVHQDTLTWGSKGTRTIYVWDGPEAARCVELLGGYPIMTPVYTVCALLSVLVPPIVVLSTIICTQGDMQS